MKRGHPGSHCTWWVHFENIKEHQQQAQLAITFPTCVHHQLHSKPIAVGWSLRSGNVPAKKGG